MSVLTKKLSYLIAGQLPEFVRTEYPTFTNFLVAYYTFLEQNGQAHAILLNSSTWADIDQTLDLFLPEFRKQYARDFPQETLVDFRRLVKYINSYYEAKGSKQATELFFRTLFDSPSSLFYPGQYVLRASDGRWTTTTTVRLESTAFPTSDPFELSGRTVTFRFRQILPVVGDVQTTVEAGCLSVRRIAQNIYEMAVTLDATYVFPNTALVISELAATLGAYDSHIYVQNGNVTYGTLSKQVTSVVSIDVPGSYFRTGEVYTFTSGAATAKLQIARTFDNDAPGPYFEIPIDPLDLYNDEDYAEDATPRKVNLVKILTPGYRFPRASETVSVAITPNETGDDLELTLGIGYIRVSEGKYKGKSGFLSDIYRLQDNKFYQPYSYVIKSEIPRDRWESLYRKTTHPGGMAFFANLLLPETIPVNLLTAESSITQTISPILFSYRVGDDLSGATFSRNSTASYNENV